MAPKPDKRADDSVIDDRCAAVTLFNDQSVTKAAIKVTNPTIKRARKDVVGK